MKLSWTKLEASGDPEHGIPCSRSSHGVSYLNDSLLVYGGENVARTPIEEEANKIWVCSGVTSTLGTWKRISLEGKSPPSRIAHAQAAYNDRYIYVFGGRAGITMKEQAMNDMWVLDTESWTWNEVPQKGDIPEARSFHKMICVGPSLFLFGGCGVNGRLNCLHQFDIATNTWKSCGSSNHLKGRGGPNLIALKSKIAVVAGFAGEETNDGHCYDLEKNAWDEESINSLLADMRKRSVCSSASFPSLNLAVIFGGEVDPSHRGHEGAGGFERDVVLLDGSTGAYISSQKEISASWPDIRGWADADGTEIGGEGHFYVFGGLAGNDENPERLADLWRLTLSKE